ncbi:MAG TPA: GDSL-type esterase/lipase family protein [Mucilaginibacter sp.]|nr:GDSL-type esterase/lipase family protein [Mucilaginibacter sp.]
MAKPYFFIIGLFVLQFSVNAQNKLKVACIGASITYGARIENREQNCYPAQLQQMLGNNYKVTNYGVSGTTLIKKGDLPYWNTNEYKTALAANPDIVIIDLGGNDSKLINRIYLQDYERDYHEFIQSFTQLPSHPRIVLLLAMPSFEKDTTGIWDPVIVKRVNPRIQQVAFDNKVEVVDMHSAFVDKEAITPDKIHPNKEGATIMAQTIYENIAQKKDTAFNIFQNLKTAYKVSSFYGYECADFTFDNRNCKIVKPKWSAPGHPWIWRARFWGHEPQTDISLLQRGFHLVYCDVAELLGNDESIKYWNDFYNLVYKAGLGKKAVMEGMSRGGVYVFNWAAVNPNKVACVYVDNPLLNIPSWAKGHLKTPAVKDDMFEAFKKDYNLTTDEQVLEFKGSPVDKIKQIVKGKYPILILCADEDEAVSPADNTLLFEKLVKELNGNIEVVHKPGFKHHPHSLPNPKPITDFILKGTGQYLQAPENN